MAIQMDKWLRVLSFNCGKFCRSIALPVEAGPQQQRAAERRTQHVAELLHLETIVGVAGAGGRVNDMNDT